MKKNFGGKDAFLYGIGGIGEDIAYNLFYMFFIYFLTSAAGIEPAAAGTISLIAVWWDAISDPLVGYLSDHCKGWKGFGKRGLFILAGSIPLGISVFLLFCDVDFGQTGKVVYFIIINILFWMFFTFVDIPYISVAAEVTDNYDTKTRMRTFVMLFSNLGQLVLSFGILKFLDYMESSGNDDVLAWRIIGAVLGFVSAISYLLAALSLRGKEHEGAIVELKTEETLPNRMEEGAAGVGLLGDMKNMLKMRDYILVLLIAFVYNIYLGVINSSLVYYMTLGLGFSKTLAATLSSISLLMSAAIVVVMGQLVVKFGKKTVQLAAFAYLTIFAVICGFFNPPMIPFIFLRLGLTLAASLFWINIYAMNYDVDAIYEYKYGKNREGLMISITSFMTKIGISVGMWLNGILMSKLGVDPNAEVIDDVIVDGMHTIFGKVPALIGLVLVILCAMYRIKKKHIVAMEEAKALREEGKPYSTETFEHLL